MAAPPNLASPEKQALDANDRYLQNYLQRANDAYLYISTYQFNANPMVSFSWTAPTSNVFSLDMMAGNLALDGQVIGSMTSAQKVIFFRYLKKFIGLCLKNYNQNYNL